MKRFICAGVVSLTLSAFGLFAQNGAKEDMKQAGRDTKDAAKSTGRATKKTVIKADRAVKHGTHVTGQESATGCRESQRQDAINEPAGNGIDSWTRVGASADNHDYRLQLRTDAKTTLQNASLLSNRSDFRLSKRKPS